MRITILCIGKIKEKYLTQGIAEYLKRLTPYCRLEIIELDEERLPDNPSIAQNQQSLAKEGERLLKNLRATSYLVVLDVGGKQLSSVDLAGKFETLAVNGKSDLTFIIGGAFGISPQVLEAAEEHLSFSKMTFTHQMIRLLLIEQIYRGFKIWRKEPYHW